MQIEDQSLEGKAATSGALRYSGEAGSHLPELDADALRDAARILTKKKSSMLHKVTGGAATKIDFANMNDEINLSASGRGTGQLRTQLRITGTPRDYMDAVMLHAVACQEEAITTALERSFHTRGCKSLPVPDAMAVGLCVTAVAAEICRNSGVWARPMLTQRLAAGRQVKQAAARKPHAKGQPTLWQCLKVKPIIS